MAEMKLFEVRLKWSLLAETKEQAEQELLKAFGAQAASMELKEVRAGIVIVHSEPNGKPELDLQVPEIGLDDIPF